MSTVKPLLVRKSDLWDVIRQFAEVAGVRRIKLEEDRDGQPPFWLISRPSHVKDVPPGRYVLKTAGYTPGIPAGYILTFLEVPSSPAYERAQRRKAEADALERRLMDAYREGQQNGKNSGSCGFQWIRIAKKGGEPLYKPSHIFCLGSCTDGDCDHGKVPVEVILQQLGYSWVWMWNAD